MRGIVRSGLLIVLLSYCKLAVALEPTIRVVVERPQRPVVNGQTNLPDGTELMISIRRKESNYFAEDQVNVSGGSFRSQKFSERGSDLNPGKYSVEVLMPFPGVQGE